MTAAAGILADADGAGTPSAGGASAEELLARALEVIDQQAARIDELARENAEQREQNAELARVNGELRDLVGGQAASWPRRMRPSRCCSGSCSGGRRRSRARPRTAAVTMMPALVTAAGSRVAGEKQVKRGPGARSGRRGYSGLPRFEVFWDFPGGGYCCPECGEPLRAWAITGPGSSWTGR